ncbi:hypothetical protein THAOC_28369, partial [Thalassiosira oceanica]
ANGKTSEIFRDDGVHHSGSGVRTDFHGFDLSRGDGTGLTFSAQPILFGDKAVQIRDWRIRQINSDNLSVTNENGNVSRIYRSDGTVHGNITSLGGYVTADLGEPACVYLTSSFLQIGDWRFGEITSHLSVTHKDGQTAMIYRHDGTIHPGPRSDYNAWTLVDDEVLAGTKEGCQSPSTPTTSSPTTQSPTQSPTTQAPTTSSPTTQSPTQSPSTESPTTSPTTQAPVTQSPTQAPTTSSPTTQSPTQSPTTQAPTTSSPTTQSPTQSPSTESPTTSAPTVHPFTGYEQVGGTGAGECADKDGGLFSYAQYNENASAEDCSVKCSGLATSAQVGLGVTPSACRCYFDGSAPDDEGQTFTSVDESGTGPVAGVNNESGENWQCYRRIAAGTVEPTTKPTEVPTAPVTQSPTQAPTTSSPTTQSPTQSPTTQAPTTSSPTTQSPTQSPSTESPTTSPTTQAPVTQSPTQAPTTSSPTTQSPTQSPTTQAPTTVSPTTQAPTTLSLLSCPSVGSPMTILQPGPKLVNVSSSGSFCGIFRRTQAGDLIPLARSYNGNGWEPSAGPFALSFGEILGSASSGGTESRRLTSSSSNIVLPELVDPNESYVILSKDGSSSDRRDIASWLEMITFGQKMDEIDLLDDGSWGSIARAQFLLAQMNTTLSPATSHREYYRRRANSKYIDSSQVARSDHPCSVSLKLYSVRKLTSFIGLTSFFKWGSPIPSGGGIRSQGLADLATNVECINFTM